MEIMTRNIPDTVVILRDQAEEFPLCPYCVSDYISSEDWSLKDGDM